MTKLIAKYVGGLAVLVLCLGGAVFYGRWTMRPAVDLAEAKLAGQKADQIAADARARQRVAEMERDIEQARSKAEAEHARAVALAHARRREVKRYAEHIVTPAVDRRYPVPRALICVFEQAAASTTADYPGVPGAPCESYDQPSTVAASTLAEVPPEWAGYINQLKAQIDGLQDYVRQTRAIWNRARQAQLERAAR